jgi:hypothetical protein
MHLRVQRLDAAVEHLREARVVAHFGDRQAGVAQHAGGAAGRQQPDAVGDESSGEFEGAILVREAEQGLTDFHGGR